MDDRTVRAALQRHWEASDASDFKAEHEIYHEDAMLHYPQSGERIRGRRNIQESRTVQPNNKRFAVRRMIGGGDFWVTEFVLSYDGTPFYRLASWNSAKDWWPSKRNILPIRLTLHPRVRILSSRWEKARHPEYSASVPKFCEFTPMSREQFWFFFPFRVRYSEIDGQGVVFNAHYLTYFDTSITEYFRALGYDQYADSRQTGIDFHVVKSLIEYKAPVLFDQEIDVGVRVARIGNSSLVFELAIFLKGAADVFVAGEIVWVYTDQKTHRPVPIPASIRELIAARERHLA